MSSQRIYRPLAVAPFIVSIGWAFVSQSVAQQAARGFALAFGLRDYAPLLSAAFFLFLLVMGFTGIDLIARRRPDVRRALGLPMRTGFGREWAVGAAIGWGMVVAAVLPVALTLSLRTQYLQCERAVAAWSTILSVAALGALALADELIFRGYPFRMLIDLLGPTWAMLAMSLLFALTLPFNLEAPAAGFCVAFALGLLLSLAYLRTHALWLPWGLHFAWNASMGVLFGLPIGGVRETTLLVKTRAIGPIWLTGGAYGPMATLWTLLVLAAGAVVLYRATRDYAWNYTHPPIVPGGYPMDAPTSPAHAAMEAAALAQPIEQPGGLVQILPAKPDQESPPGTG